MSLMGLQAILMLIYLFSWNRWVWTVSRFTDVLNNISYFIWLVLATGIRFAVPGRVCSGDYSGYERSKSYGPPFLQEEGDFLYVMIILCWTAPPFFFLLNASLASCCIPKRTRRRRQRRREKRARLLKIQQQKQLK